MHRLLRHFCHRVKCIGYNSGEEKARKRHIIVVYRQMPGNGGKQFSHDNRFQSLYPMNSAAPPNAVWIYKLVNCRERRILTETRLWKTTVVTSEWWRATYRGHRDQQMISKRRNDRSRSGDDGSMTLAGNGKSRQQDYDARLFIRITTADILKHGKHTNQRRLKIR
jgi:hypothetical protein